LDDIEELNKKYTERDKTNKIKVYNKELMLDSKKQIMILEMEESLPKHLQ